MIRKYINLNEKHICRRCSKRASRIIVEDSIFRIKILKYCEDCYLEWLNE